MSTRHPNWINGKPAEPASGEYLATINPATRQPGDEIAAGSAADAATAVAAACAAWQGWAAQPPAARSAVLHKLADLLAEHFDELARLEKATTGKTDAQLTFEINAAIDYFHYYGGIIRSFAGRVIEQGAGMHTYTRVQPYGVVAVITPWNLPLNQAARAVAPAIAVGNAVVLKPSEFTSPSTVLLARLATEAGLPDGVFNVLLGTGVDAGAPLCDHPDVRRIAFTGSVTTGKFLAGEASKRVIPTTLELGGKSPIVVFADADLDRAATAAVAGVQVNSGQVCSATTRLLVEASIHDEFVAKVAEKIKALQPGTDFGPIITEAQYGKVLDYLDWAAGEGITPAAGGGAYTDGPGAEGFYVQPTLFANIPWDGKLAQEEIFGPVLVSIPFDDEADALRIANSTEYGLVGAVWSGDAARGLRLAEQIDAGQIAVNGGVLNNETPFGGFKNSGYGREKGIEALHDYAQVKTVSLNLQ